MPNKMRIAFRSLYLVANMAINVGICCFLYYKCNLWEALPYPIKLSELRVEDEASCLPAFSASCILAILLLWVDRSASLFFRIGTPNTSMLVRSCSSAVVAGAFIAASQNDATGMLLLLLFYTGRSLGPLPSEQIRNFASASRFAVRMYACCSAFVLIWDLSRCRVDNACRATPKIASLILGSALVLE